MTQTYIRPFHRTRESRICMPTFDNKALFEVRACCRAERHKTNGHNHITFSSLCAPPGSLITVNNAAPYWKRQLNVGWILIGGHADLLPKWGKLPWASAAPFLSSFFAFNNSLQEITPVASTKEKWSTMWYSHHGILISLRQGWLCFIHPTSPATGRSRGSLTRKNSIRRRKLLGGFVIYCTDWAGGKPTDSMGR